MAEGTKSAGGGPGRGGVEACERERAVSAVREVTPLSSGGQADLNEAGGQARGGGVWLGGARATVVKRRRVQKSKHRGKGPPPSPLDYLVLGG